MTSSNYTNNDYYMQNSSDFYSKNQPWGNWNVTPDQYAPSLHRSPGFPTTQSYQKTTSRTPQRSPIFYRYINNTNNRVYPQRRFPTSPPQYSSTTHPPQSWPITTYYHNKRQLSESSENLDMRLKPNKKKKKPLSQNIPNRKDWSVDEAMKALALEKEYNKMHKHHSLIIKFPDLEVNRDIVSKFHSAIESVHFQQPSTPRFCFVSLEESADAEAVIAALNKTKFGDGYLTAEYKRDREEDHNIGPEDIDPLTLYVGNLAQEVTKEDMVKAYPKQRRIDIGYAKKMKYTRYAFVSFKTVPDCMEAFQKTHSTQMYSKSLIVRFRRLPGTVGMPGEAKTQTNQRRKDDSNDNLNSELYNFEASPATSPVPESRFSDNDISHLTDNDSQLGNSVDLNLVKREPNVSDYESEMKKLIDRYKSPFLSGSIEVAFSEHRPKIKTEIKEEGKNDDEKYFVARGVLERKPQICSLNTNVKIKNEPTEKRGASQHATYNNEDDDEDIDDAFLEFRRILNNLNERANTLNTLRKIGP